MKFTHVTYAFPKHSPRLSSRYVYFGTLIMDEKLRDVSQMIEIVKQILYELELLEMKALIFRRSK